jgi:NAD(P)-dependent dehydrogenase (short-subunit alcohol dehydrogenase family)
MVLSLRVDGKIAVVTGSGQGIGRAYALGLAEAGAHVIVAEIDDRTGPETVAAIEAQGGRAEFVHADVSDAASIAALATSVRDAHQRVDIVVNNAALDGAPAPAPLMELEPEDYDRVMAVNAKGMWLVVKALVPLLRRAGGGSIINQGSAGAFMAIAGLMPYCASKNAVIGITKTLARELGPDGIRVNCLAPGFTLTESVDRRLWDADMLEGLVAAQCLNATQRPEDLVGPLLFLATDASRFVTGQTLISDGGVIMLP